MSTNTTLLGVFDCRSMHGADRMLQRSKHQEIHPSKTMVIIYSSTGGLRWDHVIGVTGQGTLFRRAMPWCVIV